VATWAEVSTPFLLYMEMFISLIVCKLFIEVCVHGGHRNHEMTRVCMTRYASLVSWL
jgi:hypothetical protein